MNKYVDTFNSVSKKKNLKYGFHSVSLKASINNIPILINTKQKL